MTIIVFRGAWPRPGLASSRATAVAKALLGHQVVYEIGMVGVDTRVEERHHDAIAAEAVSNQHVGLQQHLSLDERSLDETVQVDAFDLRVTLERRDRLGSGPSCHSGERLVAATNVEGAPRKPCAARGKTVFVPRSWQPTSRCC